MASTLARHKVRCADSACNNIHSHAEMAIVRSLCVAAVVVAMTSEHDD